MTISLVYSVLLLNGGMLTDGIEGFAQCDMEENSACAQAATVSLLQNNFEVVKGHKGLAAGVETGQQSQKTHGRQVAGSVWRNDFVASLTDGLVDMNQESRKTQDGPLEDGVSLLQEGKSSRAATPKAAASSPARALAWLHLQVETARSSSAGSIVPWLAVFVLIAAAMGLMFFLIGRGGASQLGPSWEADNFARPDPRILQPAGASPLISAKSPQMGQFVSQQADQPAGQQMRSPLMPSSGSPVVAQMQAALLQEQAQRPDVPPICPSLILPHTEARFMLPREQMDGLQRAATGSVDILGTSRKKLLHALIHTSPDGRRCLMLSSCGCEDDPRTCTFTSASGDLEVFGKAGKFYGWIKVNDQDKQATLSYSGSGGESKDVMQIQLGSDTRREVYAMNGQPLASTSIASDFWTLQAKPGADAVLITSCILALELLR